MRWTRLLVLGSLLCQAGFLVAGAQAWAWASMLRSGQTLAQAVEGRRPCSVCRRIRRAKPAGSLAPRMFSPALDWTLPGRRPMRVAEAVHPAAPFVAESVPEPVRAEDFPPPRLRLS